MRIIILSICFLATLIIETHSDDGDDPAAINEEILGKDKFCFFAIAAATDPEIMRDDSPNAQKYGIGCIDKQRLAYAWIPALQESDLTIVPDEKQKVYGTAYSVPLCEFEKFKNDVGMHDGVKLFHSVKKTVEVNKDGKTVTLSCNTFPTVAEAPQNGQQLPPEQRPTKEEVDIIVKYFQKAGLPQDYIDNFSKTPTK